MDRGEKAGGEEEAAPVVVADVAAAAAEASPDQEKKRKKVSSSDNRQQPVCRPRVTFSSEFSETNDICAVSGLASPLSRHKSLASFSILNW